MKPRRADRGDRAPRSAGPARPPACPSGDRIVPPGRPNPRAELARVLLLLAAAALRGRRSSSSTRSTGCRTRRSSSASRSGSRSPSSRPRCVVDRASGSSSPRSSRRTTAPPSTRPSRRRSSSSSRRAATASRAGGCSLVGASAAGGRSAPRCSRRSPRSGPSFDLDPLLPDAVAARPAARRRGRASPSAPTTIEEDTFYTAFPEGADREQIGAPLVVVRLGRRARPAAGPRGWAPDGIVAYSKICTHAGCAISLYRKPTFAPTQPRPALVCPCHYSTFDPAHGRHGDLRPGRTGAAAAAARRRRDGPPARRRELHRRRRPVVVGRPQPGAARVIRADRPLPRPAHRHRALPPQDAALRLPGPLVVPARRGRALLVRRPRRDRRST